MSRLICSFQKGILLYTLFNRFIQQLSFFIKRMCAGLSKLCRCLKLFSEKIPPFCKISNIEQQKKEIELVHPRSYAVCDIAAKILWVCQRSVNAICHFGHGN